MVKNNYLNLLTISWSFVFLLTASFVQAKTDNILSFEYRRSNIRQVAPTNFLSAANLKNINLGFNKATADYVWLSTIQYFGGGNPNLAYDSLSDMLFSIGELDPQFEYPYLFGGVVLPWQNESEAALKLLDTGTIYFPNNGLFYYYAGSIAKLNLHDSKRAAGYFQKSIDKEGTPPAAKLLAGISLTSLDDREFAKTWWEGVLETEENESIKARAKVWLEYLNLTIDLESLIQQIQNQTDLKISKLEDLVTSKYLKEIPTTELGELVFDPVTQKVKIKDN